MDLPDLPDLSDERLAAVLARHGLSGAAVAKLPDIGIFNAIFTIGDSVVLRVPRVHPVFVASAHKEAVAVPAARQVGVHTPALLAFDDTLEVLPVPYSLYARVAGENLERLNLDATDSPAVYRELGRDLGRLHDGIDPVGPIADLALEELSGQPRDMRVMRHPIQGSTEWARSSMLEGHSHRTRDLLR